MNTTQNTLLITGGSSGIGLALAERFLATANTVIICGRDVEKLQAVQARLPDIHIKVCDVGKAVERESLVTWVADAFPELNVLVNNAGIQHRTNLLTTDRSWEYLQQEIAINLEAPLHLSLLLARRLVGKPQATIINVTSGLAFTPLAAAPIYGATKAAVHAFTLNLRVQLAAAGVDVLEIVPPAVNTDLGGVGLHRFGVPLEDFADAVMQGLAKGEQVVGYGTSEKAIRMSPNEIAATIAALNERLPIPE